MPFDSHLPAARAASPREAGCRALCALALLLFSGCTRAMYREQADAEVYAAVREKANDPRWDLKNYTIDIDPRSRMYDGYDPDNEPLPPDDPTSHKLMHYVDGMEGYPCWHLNGDIDIVENPQWLSHLARNAQGEILLDLNQSVRLGLLHSREYHASSRICTFRRWMSHSSGFASMCSTSPATTRFLPQMAIAVREARSIV